ncbi:transposase [Streptomyces europaeiscabiei]|uniref:transposase n=1 Tax=Streptomyces europaeiscabiei TaxID=146819 RepID=UPI0029CA4B2F|nr:transposase [Streptomyces europaeiscabiei]
MHLVPDRYSAHRSRKIRAWLADRPDRIELYFLPLYSPELSPEDLVDADLKRSLPAAQQGPGTGPTRHRHSRVLPPARHQPHIVRGHFGGPHVRYLFE